jgi:hypothetical protein
MKKPVLILAALCAIPTAALADETLNREVTILVPAGFFLWSAAAWLEARTWPSFARAIVCGLALLPFLVWRETLILTLDAAPGSGNNIGWPGVGFVETVGRILSPASYPGFPQLTRGHDWLMALALVGVAGFLLRPRHMFKGRSRISCSPTV